MELFDKRSAPRRSDTWFVYSLADSRSPSLIRYVGITNDPARRLSSHISVAQSGREHGHKSSWIRSVVAGGGDVLIGVLHDKLTHSEASSLEIRIIANMRESGARLTNTTAGGRGGMLGSRHSDSARRCIGEASSARPRTEATRARLSLTFRRSGPQNNSTVGYKGVTEDVERKKWSARVTVNGLRQKLGRFTTPEAAARAYDAAAYAAWGRDCYLNFPAEIAA